MTALATRDRLIDKALDLFYQHGFHAIGIDRVIKEVGVTKTTLYNHFDCKDDLILAVVQKRDAWWRKTFRGEIRRRGGTDPIAQLRAVFDVLQYWFGTPDFHGCLFINAACEFPSPHDLAHQAAKANVDAIRAIIAELAEQAGFAQSGEFARQLNLLIEGAIVTEVIDRDGKAAETAKQVAHALIQHHLTASI